MEGVYLHIDNIATRNPRKNARNIAGKEETIQNKFDTHSRLNKRGVRTDRRYREVLNL